MRAGWPAGDSVAALFVAALVLSAAVRLMRRNVDVLMDRAPADAEEAARLAIAAIEPAVTLRRMRMRSAAGHHFADVVIAVSPDAAVGQGHAAADAVEAAVERALPETDVVVHVEPAEEDAVTRELAHAAAMKVPRVREIHNISVLRVDGRTEVSLHLKLPGELSLGEAHAVASEVEHAIEEALPGVDTVLTHLEPLAEEAEGQRVAGSEVARDAEAVARIVVDQTGAPPRELRFLQTDGRARRLPHARPRPGRPAGGGARAGERDRGADPPRAAGDLGDHRPHRTVKLCMFTPKELALERGWPGRIDGDRVIQLAAQTLQSFFTGGGEAREHAEYPLADVLLRAPVLRPPAVRDFYAFEQHVRTARESRGFEVPAEWYEQPVFYFSNPAAIFGPEDEVPYPEGTGGARLRARGGGGHRRRGRDRRLHGDERLVGARSPALGDEGRARARPKGRTSRRASARSWSRRTSSTVRAGRWSPRVNGEERSRGELADMYFSWERVVEHASTEHAALCRATCSAPGRSAPGCILELGDGRWLRPGDVVELEVEGIGRARRNTVWPVQTVACRLALLVFFLADGDG